VSNKSARLLVVDTPEQAETYRQALASLAACQLSFESTFTAAQKRLESESFEMLISAVEIEQPAGGPASVASGIKLVEQARRLDPSLSAILIADKLSVETATDSLRAGAGDYLARSSMPVELAASVQRLLNRRRIDAENKLLRRQVERPYSFDDIIGTCPAMQKVYETIRRVADSDVDVLIVGETGTGKELVARSIHRRSRRVDKPFVPVDCGAIPENLLESEFFGHERGAFTGAENRTIGLVEFADGGTFFLDELGELPLLLQAKLLRTLQERKIRRVGGRTEIDVDVRIVAATARDLEAMIEHQTFRRDLYYRINVVEINLPPLRERGDDLGLLAEHFARKHSREMGREIAGLSPEAYQVMSQYSWPGNVRELQNVMRRAIALTGGSLVGLDDLPDELVASAGRSGLDASAGYFELRDAHQAKFERQYLSELLQRHRGDIRLAAEEAKLPRGTLYRLMKNHGLDPAEFRVSNFAG